MTEGTVFGRYRLLRQLGRGGMGEVFAAVDTVKGREVALKRLKREYAEDPDFQARFRREAELAARLRDPHVIPIHDYGEIDGQLYLDMRLVDGVDLERVLNRGRLPPPTVLDVLAQTAAALDSAHAAGLVHRDVKPSNIVLTGDPERGGYFAYLVDFGVARPLLGHGGSKITATIGTVGTVAYLAPERIEGLTGDARADVYSLACVLYQCLTERCPYEGEPFAVLFAHVHKPPPRATEQVPELPPAIDDVIARGMAKRAEDRYPTAGELIQAARAALAGDLAASSATRIVAPAQTRAVTPEQARAVTPAQTPAGPEQTRAAPAPMPRAGRAALNLLALGLALAGTVAGVLSFTVLHWFSGGTDLLDQIAPRSRFSQLGSRLATSLPSELNGHVSQGASSLYFGGLAWVVLIVAAALAVASALPVRRGASLLRAAAVVVAALGLGFTLWAVDLVSFDSTAASYFGAATPGYGGWLAHMSVGAWFALAAFVLIGLGSALGPRRARTVTTA